MAKNTLIPARWAIVFFFGTRPPHCIALSVYSLCRYRVFIKYCVFSLKCCHFSKLCQICRRPTGPVHTLTTDTRVWSIWKTQKILWTRCRFLKQYALDYTFSCEILLACVSVGKKSLLPYMYLWILKIFWAIYLLLLSLFVSNFMQSFWKNCHNINLNSVFQVFDHENNKNVDVRNAWWKKSFWLGDGQTFTCNICSGLHFKC